MGEKIGVIDVGGGFRDIYAAGVLDYCMDHQVEFDLGIGVSAGSANLIAYAARQPRRNYRFYTEYGQRREYASLHNFLHKHSFVDLDYAYGTLSSSHGEYPLDYAAFAANPMEFYVVATDAETGAARYFGRESLHQDDYRPLMGSSALPLACPPYPIEGRPYYDGALSDPVPLDKAFSLGCDRVVLILSLPRDYLRLPEKDGKVAHHIGKHYPEAARQLMQRATRYNECVARALAMEQSGRALVIAPDDTCGVRTLTRDPQLLDQLYRKGYADGARIPSFVQNAQQS